MRKSRFTEEQIIGFLREVAKSLKHSLATRAWEPLTPECVNGSANRDRRRLAARRADGRRSR